MNSENVLYMIYGAMLALWVVVQFRDLMKNRRFRKVIHEGLGVFRMPQIVVAKYLKRREDRFYLGAAKSMRALRKTASLEKDILKEFEDQFLYDEILQDFEKELLRDELYADFKKISK